MRVGDDRKVFDAVDQVEYRCYCPVPTLCVCFLRCMSAQPRAATESQFVCAYLFLYVCVCVQDGNKFLTYQDIEKLSRDMGEQMNFQQLNTIMDTATEQGTMRRVPFERFEEVCAFFRIAFL